MSTLIVEYSESGPIARRVRSIRHRGECLGWDLVRNALRYAPDDDRLAVCEGDTEFGSRSEVEAHIDNMHGSTWLNHGEYAVEWLAAPIYREVSQ